MPRRVPGKAEVQRRFLTLTSRDPITGCLEWTGAYSTTSSYGQYRWPRGWLMPVAKTSAPRVAWRLFRGPLGPSDVVCHNCPHGDNPKCVDPDHLFVGSQSENMLDSVAKGRHFTPWRKLHAC